jgi:RNA polymerase sigma-70 factor (ECF subfamily)
MGSLSESVDASARHARDLEFTRRVAARDPDALDELNQRLACLPAMVRYQHQRLGGALDALELEDVVRETTLALWAKLPTFEGRSTLETWAFRFAMLEILKALQARARRASNLEAPEEHADHRDERETQTLDYDAAELRSALEALSPDAALVIRMRHWDEQPFERIAERTGLPLNTIKARYYRGLARLKEILERRERSTA